MRRRKKEKEGKKEGDAGASAASTLSCEGEKKGERAKCCRAGSKNFFPHFSDDLAQRRKKGGKKKGRESRVKAGRS